MSPSPTVNALCAMLIPHSACDGCKKATIRCFKPVSAQRRTACKSCSAQKKQCSSASRAPRKTKHPGVGSAKAKGNSDAVHDYFVVRSVENLRQDVLELRRDMAGIMSGQAALLAHAVAAKSQLGRIEALLRCMVMGDEEVVEDDANMEVLA